MFPLQIGRGLFPYTWKSAIQTALRDSIRSFHPQAIESGKNAPESDGLGRDGR